jgi:hypothetical protein
MSVDAPNREPELLPTLAPALSSDADDHEDAPLLPFERQPAESSAAWVAFQKYRDLGPRRSLSAVERLLYPPAPTEEPQESHTPECPEMPIRRRGSLSRWSRQHDWVRRAAAWDAFLDHESRITQVEAVRAMNSRHATEARALQAKAIEALRILAAGDLDMSDIVRSVVEGSKLERLALGEVTDAVRQEQRSESKVTLEVVERLVATRDEVVPPTPAALALPPATGGADAVPIESLGDDVAAPDADIGDLTLPDEAPAALSGKPQNDDTAVSQSAEPAPDQR